MTKTKLQTKFKKIINGLLVLALVVASFLPITASAAQITPRKVTLSTSQSAASNVTYTFNFTVPTTGTAIKSASFQFCDAASGTCNAPGSFVAGSAALASQPTNLGAASGWTNSNATNSIRILNAGNATSPTGAQTVVFNTVTNPTLANGTFFIRIATFSGSDWTTGPLDTGVVAASTAGQITVTAAVDETLSMTLASATVALGTLSTSATGTGTSTVAIATNAATGYSLSYSSGGNTLTSAGGSITAMPGGVSNQNSKQFGINLMSNSTPSIGSNVSGSGSGAALAGYNTTNNFKFLITGDSIASATVPTNTNTFTVSYIANIDGVTAPGAYQAVITYIATANF